MMAYQVKVSSLAKMLTFGLVGLVGCATTPNLTPQEQLAKCQSSDWQAIGLEDGSLGRSGAYFGSYVEQCQSLAPLGDEARQSWEAGRQQGLLTFCTELNAYKLGREGYAWQPVCPLDNTDIDIAKLEKAYSEGRYYYLREQDMERLAMPWYGYPYGYGRYGRGWRDPFWHPFW